MWRFAYNAVKGIGKYNMENNEKLEKIKQELNGLDDEEEKSILEKITEKMGKISCYEDLLSEFCEAEAVYGPADQEFEKIEVMMLEYMIERCRNAFQNELAGKLLNELGAKYYTGDCFDVDYEKAIQYYSKAEEYGNAIAIENLGYCFYYGKGCSKSFEEAYKCFSLAYSLSKSCICLYKLGDMHKNGYYVEKNETVAFRLYKEAYDIACDDNYLYSGDAAMRLADCYKNGIGTAENINAALHYYLDAEIRLLDKNNAGIAFTEKMLNRVKDEVNELNEQSKKIILVD